MHFINKETPAQVFSCDFCKIIKNIFFIEHLQATASENIFHNSFFVFQIESVCVSIFFLHLTCLCILCAYVPAWCFYVSMWLHAFAFHVLTCLRLSTQFCASTPLYTFERLCVFNNLANSYKNGCCGKYNDKQTAKRLEQQVFNRFLRLNFAKSWPSERAP